jgi:hypothetical protein
MANVAPEAVKGSMGSTSGHAHAFRTSVFMAGGAPREQVAPSLCDPVTPAQAFRNSVFKGFTGSTQPACEAP